MEIHAAFKLELKVLFGLFGWVDQLSAVHTVEISANFQKKKNSQ